MTGRDLTRLFAPESIAIVGASANPAAIGGQPIAFLQAQGFAGRIYPVNPKYPEVAGLPCYPALADLPEAPDIVVVAVSAALVPETITAAGAIGARFAIQAMVAKLGGLKMALSLDEDSLATAVQNLIAYVETGEVDETPEESLNRLSLALRIIVLTILQSRGIAPDPQFPEEMERALAGATSLLRSFSRAE